MRDVHNEILYSFSVASSIRQASNQATSSPSNYIAESKKANHPILSSSANKTRRVSDDEEPTAQHDRNRHKLMYDEEDDTKSIPKLEKEIVKDRERIELERKQRELKNSAKKPPASKDKSFAKASGSRDNSKKIDSSAGKFKDFLTSDVNASSGSDNDKDTRANDDKLALQKINTSLSKVDTNLPSAKKPSTDPNTSNVNSPLPPKKRPSSPNRAEEPIRKKIKSPVKDKNKIYKPFNKLLQGVVIVISGIQVGMILTIFSFRISFQL